MTIDVITLDFEIGRTGYSIITGNTAGAEVDSAGYTINPDCLADIATTLGRMSGVSIEYSAGTLSIFVTPPYGSDQIELAASTVVAIDPTAVSTF